MHNLVSQLLLHFDHLSQCVTKLQKSRSSRSQHTCYPNRRERAPTDAARILREADRKDFADRFLSPSDRADVTPAQERRPEDHDDDDDNHGNDEDHDDDDEEEED